MKTIKSIEEKAKRYDEAIEQLRKMMPNWENLSYNGKTFLQDLVHIIPELKESEDERIRKEIMHHIEFGCSHNIIPHQRAKLWIAWLEKQGEHANFLNKIQIGDKVTRNEDGVLVNLSQLNRVAKKEERQGENSMGISETTKQKLEDNLNKALEKETPESLNEFLDEQGEQNPADTKEYDFHGIKFIPKFAKGDIIKDKKRGEVSTIKDFSYDTGLYTHTYGQFPITIQDNYEIIKQKPAWSEEDEKMYTATIFALAGFMGNEDKIDWLQGIKDRVQPQNTWKPSDKQLDALHDAAVYVDKSMFPYPKGILMKLYEQLKKLKG